MALFQRRRSLRSKADANAPLGLVVPSRAEVIFGEPYLQGGVWVRDVIRDEVRERELARRNGTDGCPVVTFEDYEGDDDDDDEGF